MLQRQNDALRDQLQDSRRRHAAIRNGAEEAYQQNQSHIDDLTAQLDVRAPCC